jgi:hypothetical protein
LDEESPDYSEFVSYMGGIHQVLSIFAGFTFTAITLLLTTLPDKSSLPVQGTFVFLSLLFHLFIMLVAWDTTRNVTFLRRTPPYTRAGATWDVFYFLSIALFGLSIPVMYWLWGLDMLALITLLIGMAILAVAVALIWRPYTEFRQKKRPL